jgi:hypothetical protein
MAQPQPSPLQRNHIPPIHDFLEWLRDNVLLAIKDSRTQEIASFVPVNEAKAYLAENRSTRLEDILDELFNPLEPPFDSDTILNSYVAVFCILLEMEKGTAIADFVNHDLNDQKLPFDPNHEPPPGFPPDTGAGGFYKLFCERQWRFCVPSFQKNMGKVFQVDRILPIAYNEKIADGGSGAIIQMIKLHSSYNLLAGRTTVVWRPQNRIRDIGTDWTQNPNDPLANTFALKSYLSPDAARNYECEVEAFRRVNRPPNPHLIGFYGNYIIKGHSYNLILEYADQGTLEEYFEKTAPPCEEEDIVKFWTGMFGILKAIDGIHKSAPRRIAGESMIPSG